MYIIYTKMSDKTPTSRTPKQTPYNNKNFGSLNGVNSPNKTIKRKRPSSPTGRQTRSSNNKSFFSLNGANSPKKTRRNKRSPPHYTPEQLKEPEKAKFSIEFELKDETHYTGKVSSPELSHYPGGHQILNPWHSIQLNKSHGLCQMFSFFLLCDQKYMNESPFSFIKPKDLLTKTFINTTKNKSDILSIFRSLVRNTSICMKRSLDLIDAEITKDSAFKDSFEDIYIDVRDSVTETNKYVHDFEPRTASYKTFLEDLRTIAEEQNIMRYMLDQFNGDKKGTLPSYVNKDNVDELISSYFNDYFNDNSHGPEPIYDEDKDEVKFKWNEHNDLVVHPNDGECAYDAFQSVFMAIMGTEDTPKRRSPFALLCEKKGITMVEKK